MLFSITTGYTAQIINAMRQNPATNRREALDNLCEAAGAKVTCMYDAVAAGLVAAMGIGGLISSYLCW
jgi:hypothetical protein